MKGFLRIAIVSFFCATVLASGTASAQTVVPVAPVPAPPQKLINYRGMEFGFDVTAARQGEFGIHWGAASTRSVLSILFTAMDEGIAVPCSVGVMYEHLFTKDRVRITPVAGASLTRVFSCAGDSDGIRPSPNIHAEGTVSGGVRIPMFAGQYVVGSLKVTGFWQRRFGLTEATDTSAKGVTLGFVIGRR
jgi:hypothetical protein